MLVRITKVAPAIWTLDQAKAWLRQDLADEDALITTLLATATAYVEQHARMDFSHAVYQLILDQFPVVNWYQYYPVMAPFPQLLTQGKNFFLPNQTIDEPVYPVTVFDFIKYYDADGLLQTLDPAQYTVDLAASRVAPTTNKIWPWSQNKLNSITIQFQAGFADGVGVPPELAQAILHYLLLAHEYREGIPQTQLDTLNRFIEGNRHVMLV